MCKIAACYDQPFCAFSIKLFHSELSAICIIERGKTSSGIIFFSNTTPVESINSINLLLISVDRSHVYSLLFLHTDV